LAASLLGGVVRVVLGGLRIIVHLLVISALVVLGGFAMIAGSDVMVFRRSAMMLGCVVSCRE
jgi:hypothetical protein